MFILKKTSIILTLCLLFSSILGGGSFLVNAQGSQRGLIITPAITELDGERGRDYKIDIKLENDNSDKSPIVADAFVQYFVAGKNEGEPIPTDTPPKENNNPILAFENPKIALAGGESNQSRVNIQIPENTDPGGYYYALTYAINNPETTEKKISVKKRLVALLFLNVKGEIQKETKIVQFKPTTTFVDPFFDSLSVDYQIKVVGNSFVRPQGDVYLDDGDGKRINSKPLNPDQKIILPNTTRSFQSSFDVPKFIFGKKTLNANVIYTDGIDNIIQQKSSVDIVFLPWRYMIIGVCILLLIVLSALIFFKRKPRII